MSLEKTQGVGKTRNTEMGERMGFLHCRILYQRSDNTKIHTTLVSAVAVTALLEHFVSLEHLLHMHW